MKEKRRNLFYQNFYCSTLGLRKRDQCPLGTDSFHVQPSSQKAMGSCLEKCPSRVSNDKSWPDDHSLFDLQGLLWNQLIRAMKPKETQSWSMGNNKGALKTRRESRRLNPKIAECFHFYFQVMVMIMFTGTKVLQLMKCINDFYSTFGNAGSLPTN